MEQLHSFKSRLVVYIPLLGFVKVLFARLPYSDLF